MTVASLVVGICAVVLASLSLGWQAANYVLTGGRVKITLLIGALGDGMMVTNSPDKLSPQWVERFADQGFQSPVVAVKVANVGRQPVTVARWGLKSGLGLSIYPLRDSIGASLPHRLEVGESETWAVDFGQVQRFIQTTRDVLVKPRPGPGVSIIGRLVNRTAAKREGLVAVVDLAAGRTKRSRQTIR